MLPYNPHLKGFSRTLRRNLTDAENALWRRLRGKQLLGLQFYRQKPLAGFIVDFYSAKAKLVIELDGSQHAEAQAYDSKRDEILRALGLEVLRFDNDQVLREIDGVLEVIFNTVRERGV